ncbi:hypothetical protein GCM10023085_41470 [Actinomadura viridis]|uniref:Uncharacterized protein n=1 Tax=Actinomadura viridis TaxID=58110 RepID=A0A931DRP9_9ACTN|nr:hypothetical protein [Actinomadura viridis]
MDVDFRTGLDALAVRGERHPLRYDPAVAAARVPGLLSAE